MNRSQTVRIADAMCALRPDWKQGGCISQLQVRAHTWQGTDAELAAHALLVAGDPTSLTPAAINNTPPASRNRWMAPPGRSKEPPCYICGNTRSGCQQLHDFEVAHGLPAPHIYETSEEADANSGHVQFDPQMLALAAMPAVNRHEDSPERAAAKARARQAVDTARQKSKWKPKPEPDTRPVQEPWPEETPVT